MRQTFLSKGKLAPSPVLIFITSVQCEQNAEILFTSHANAGSRFLLNSCCAPPQRQLHLSPPQIPFHVRKALAPEVTAVR